MKILMSFVLLFIGLMSPLIGQELTKEIIGVWSVEKMVRSDKVVDDKIGKEYQLIYEFKSNGKAVCTYVEGADSQKAEMEYTITDDGKFTLNMLEKGIQSAVCEIKENKLTVTHADGESMTLGRKEVTKEK